jgi:WD40 repeat protein
VSTSNDKTVRLWDLESGCCLALAHCDPACTEAVAAHGWLIAATADETVAFQIRNLELFTP